VKTDPARADQDEEILRLRCAGLSLRAIGERVGLSHQGVSDRITDAIRELVSPVAEEWRALETARLDDLTRRAYAVLDGAESGETALKAIAQLERLSASRRKLWALDMPQPIDVALSRRLDVEGDVVADAVAAALDVLGLDEERRQLAVRAAVARLSGEPLPEPVAPVVDEGQAVQAGMEARLRELTADEDVDVDALLAEVEREEGWDG
jgi:DNA-binding transcriptional MerR regulator